MSTTPRTDPLAFLEDVDVYLTPVLGAPVPEIGFIDPVNLEPKEVNRRQGRTFPFTPPFNYSGQPSLSLPLEVDAKGLPLGLQLIGRPWDEAGLLNHAYVLERAAGFVAKADKWW